MSTTKFMTATGSNRELHIKRSNEDHVQIRQFDPEFHTHQAKTFFLDPSEAPALCLAILEAAGYKEHSKANLGSSELLASYGMTKLRQAVQAQVREESETKSQAELEAEALELFRAFQHVRTDGVFISVPSFASLSEPRQAEWLAVARRARELAKEATK